MYLIAELKVTQTGYADNGAQLPPEVELTTWNLDSWPYTRTNMADLTTDEPLLVWDMAATQLAEWGYERTSPWTYDDVDGLIRSCDLRAVEKV